MFAASLSENIPVASPEETYTISHLLNLSSEFYSRQIIFAYIYDFIINIPMVEP